MNIRVILRVSPQEPTPLEKPQGRRAGPALRFKVAQEPFERLLVWAVIFPRAEVADVARAATPQRESWHGHPGHERHGQDARATSPNEPFRLDDEAPLAMER